LDLTTDQGKLMRCVKLPSLALLIKFVIRSRGFIRLR
jgi:hypothetical protein